MLVVGAPGAGRRSLCLAASSAFTYYAQSSASGYYARVLRRRRARAASGHRVLIIHS
jgi:hypothetical protein